jgi:hypothetical protein
MHAEGATDAGSEGEGPDGDRAAARVVLSYPADLSSWGRHQVEQRHFRAYLRKVHDEVAVGDVLEEFVGVGCCGDTLDVPLRVEAVEGGGRLGANTAIDYEEREFCGIEGNWRVQSAGGPKNADGIDG